MIKEGNSKIAASQGEGDERKWRGGLRQNNVEIKQRMTGGEERASPTESCSLRKRGPPLGVLSEFLPNQGTSLFRFSLFVGDGRRYMPLSSIWSPTNRHLPGDLPTRFYRCFIGFSLTLRYLPSKNGSTRRYRNPPGSCSSSRR